MRTALDSADNDDLRRIADALERLADHYAPTPKPITTNVTIAGDYTSSRSQLATSIAQMIRDEVKRGTIPKNWAS